MVYKQHTSLQANPAPLAHTEPPQVSRIVYSIKGLQETDFYVIKRQILKDAILDFQLFRFIYTMKSVFFRQKCVKGYSTGLCLLLLYFILIKCWVIWTIAFPLKLKKSGYSLYQQIKIRAACWKCQFYCIFQEVITLSMANSLLSIQKSIT